MIGYDVRNIIYIYIYNIRNNNKDKPALKISLYFTFNKKKYRF